MTNNVFPFSSSTNSPPIPGLYTTDDNKSPTPPALFNTAIAHELRNPLTSIMMASEVLTTMVTNEDQRTFISIIKRASLSIDKLINDLLQPKSQSYQSKKIPLCQLLDNAVGQVVERIQLKKILVTQVYTDKGSVLIPENDDIGIALSNIIVNAVDAMPDYGHLELSTLLINGRHSIRIQDNGQGISEENLKYIFNPNYTTKARGGGMGLAVTRVILKSLKISIRVESWVGIGTSFTLSFPGARRQHAKVGLFPELSHVAQAT